MKGIKGRVCAIVVAAGSSSRMEGVDKVFAELDGKPLLAGVVDVFQKSSSIDDVVIVLAKKNLEQGRVLVKERGWSKVVAVCSGGVKRQDSVRAGLKRVTSCEWVLIHDGARPCINTDIIDRGLIAAQENGSAIAAVPVKDTVKVVSRRGFIQQTPARQSLWMAQTPQVFRYDLISEAYSQANQNATDDAALVEQLGHKVEVYMGSYQNIKVTTPEDLAIAEIFLSNSKKASAGSGGACASVSATMPIS